MATTKAEIKSTYPLPLYNYKVSIDGIDIRCTEVSGLAQEVENTTYTESPVGAEVKPRRLYCPGQGTPVNFSIKRGIANREDMMALYEWVGEIQLNQVTKRDVTISLCDENGDPVVSWKVINAFPTKSEAPSFDANSNDAAIESLDLMGDDLLFFKV